MQKDPKTAAVFAGLTVVFCALTVAFALGLWGKTPSLPAIPLVAAEFTNTATVRRSYAELIQAKEDVSFFDCYGCHEKKKPPVLRFDTNQNLILPKEHEDLKMAHGRHNRNNICFNCHNEHNLELLQTRDGREIKLSDSSPLCGSCHGPTYRDWQAGIHGRVSGYWASEMGARVRKACVSCHDPHAPTFPGRKPAPGPNPLRPVPQVAHTEAHPQ